MGTWGMFQVGAVRNGHMQTFQVLLLPYNQYIYQMQQDQVDLRLQQQSQHVDNSEIVPDTNDKAQGRWEEDQHYRFLEGLFKFGKNWKEIQLLVATRVCSQVRSHAQKYFIKLQKIIKDRKKQKNRQAVELTDLEKEVLDRFQVDDITDKTPQILVSLLQNSCLMPSNKNVDRKNNVANQNPKPDDKKGPKKIEKQKVSNGQQMTTGKKTDVKKNEGDLPRQNLRSQCILDSYFDQDQDQSKSFFYRLVQNNVQHFRNGKDFSFFIDFDGGAKHHEQTHYRPEEVDSLETTRNRRASFTLVEDQQNDQRLKQALQKIKKGESSKMGAK